MKRIEIGDIGKFFKEEHEDLLRLAVLTLDTRIKTVSPDLSLKLKLDLP